MANRVVYPFLRGLLAALVAVFVAASVWLGCLQGFVFQESLYRNIAQDETFVSGMTQFVLDDLEAECLFYGLPFDTVKTVVSEEWVQVLSQEYAASVYTGLCQGTATAEFSVDPARYRTVLDDYFAALPEGHVADEEAPATIANELAESTALVLSGGLNGTVIGYGHRWVYGNTLLRQATAGWWLPLAVAVVLAVLSLLLHRGSLFCRLYTVAGSLFIGSALAAVPLWLAKHHNIADRLALGDSPMKLYADGIINGVIHGMVQTACGVMIACFVLLVVAVLGVAFEKPASKE